MRWKIVGFLGVLLLAVLSVPAFDLERIEPDKNRGIVWIGHNNPDCDSVASAFGCAALYGGKVYVSGVLNGEVRFLLRQAGCPLPEQAGELSDVRVGLVDHNGQMQAAPGVEPGKIVCVIDHHQLQDDSFRTPGIIAMDFRPWSAAAAIVADRYLKSGRRMDARIATLLLGGILSDTTNLKDDISPREREIVTALAAIAGIADVRSFGRQMLEAKSDYSALSAREVVLGDYKEYIIVGRKIGFGLAETLYPEPLKLRAAELRKELAALKAERKLDFLFFAVKDLTARRALLLSPEQPERGLAEAAYAPQIVAGTPEWLVLKKTSRKKFLIPSLRAALSAPAVRE